LQLIHLYNITDEAIGYIADGNLQLQEISLKGCYKVTNTGKQYLNQQKPLLKTSFEN
jgi:hypothetical protein